MKIRIHDTDFDGTPVECTGEFFTGATALDIINGMKMNPFNSHLEPVVFMRRTLDFIGQSEFALPDEPEGAAVAFLQRLTVTGYAKYELDDGEFDDTHPAPANGKIEK